ncbi:MAG: hypothetical protein JXN61_14325 [Sedimentisphaerales bacterium]|nr:hypothetical protein [Sedimentisphaerales bacterium]
MKNKLRFPSQICESLKRISDKVKGGLHLTGQSSDSGWGISVAAFGKHPGWNDHMEDIGLDTDVLAELKRVLYLEGIGRNIDKGTWGKDKDKPAPRDYGHEFLWVRGNDIVAGRLWPSRDGKGRSEYPMIACVHCSGLSLKFAVKTVYPLLEKIERLCVETDSADKVRQAVDTARAKLVQFVESDLSVVGLSIDYHRAIAELTTLFHTGSGQEGLIRVLYHMDRDGVGICQTPGRTVFLQQRSHARVPAPPDLHREAACSWAEFIFGRLGRTATVLVLMPWGESWMDVIIGEFTSTELYCLRASLRAITLDSDVAYDIDARFRDRINHLFQNLPAGRDA